MLKLTDKLTTKFSVFEKVILQLSLAYESIVMLSQLRCWRTQ